MKLIIDVPNDVYAKVMEYYEHNEIVEAVYGYIYRGTPIPDNATNGDVIKAIFLDAEIHLNENDVFFHHMGFWIKCNIRWWNAPYQKGGKE